MKTTVDLSSTFNAYLKFFASGAFHFAYQGADVSDNEEEEVKSVDDPHKQLADINLDE